MSDTPRLIQIEAKNDCRKTVEEALQWIDNCEAVMVVALTKDGSQILRTSTASGQQKSFMVSFLNAWLARWFNIQPE